MTKKILVLLYWCALCASVSESALGKYRNWPEPTDKEEAAHKARCAKETDPETKKPLKYWRCWVVRAEESGGECWETGDPQWCCCPG